MINCMKEPLESRLKVEARSLGFTLIGIAPATEADSFIRFEEWLSHGYDGEMAYLRQQADARRHPRAVLASVRSVVMLGFEYYDGESVTLDSGQVAKYARGPDYHQLIRDRLNVLADWLRREVPDCQTRGVVDTAPLLERDFARRAGLGWFGKNTMLINKHRGSYFFLAALLTDLALTPDQPHTASHCGTCTACLNACPTEAFPEPGVLDARKCISYLTIELRSTMPVELREGVGEWLFGCDVCQDVCPWNRKVGSEPVPFPTNPALASLNPVELLGLSDAEFRQRFRGTVFFRTKRSGLLRNAAVVLGNVGDESALPALERALHDDDAIIRDAAAWAIERIKQRTAGLCRP